ncbi:hypothetical protein TorRG33x02_132390 [Trema orientale]|uniref:Uncharacterized protein n=1 Tax=Trema orientale TaxID=63057 RepID=A0A2P5EZS7_TREOI|nr:hypothetical protein TorRG33x02_132390 [Trema orientale]
MRSKERRQGLDMEISTLPLICSIFSSFLACHSGICLELLILLCLLVPKAVEKDDDEAMNEGRGLWVKNTHLAMAPNKEEGGKRSSLTFYGSVAFSQASLKDYDQLQFKSSSLSKDN